MTPRTRRVGDVLQLERIPANPNPGMEYVSIGIRSFGKGIFHYGPKPGDQLGSLRFFELHPDRLVISNIKGWEGAVAVSGADDAGTVASNRFLIYQPIDDEIDVSWARWYFLSEPGIAQLQRASPGSADRNRTLAIDRFEALEIPLPPPSEQRRTALRLNRIESTRDSITRRVQRASELSSAIVVSSAFRSDLTSEVKQSKGWTRRRLDELLELDIDDVAVQEDGRYEIAGVYSFGRGMFRRSLIDGGATSYKSMHRLSTGQIVMSRLKAWEGAIARVPPELDGTYLSPEFPTFRVIGDVADPAFVAAVLTSEPFWSRLRGASKGIGARRERVSASRLLECEIDVPPIEAQRSIVRLASVLAAAARECTESSRRAAALVPAALNAAFGQPT